MTYQQFTDAIDSLFDYFSQKRPESESKKLWFDQVHDIPGEAVPWILSRIERTSDWRPRNIGKAFLDSFDIWKVENPAKIIPHQQVDCPTCKKWGDGFLRIPVYSHTMGRSYDRLFRCPDCQNWLSVTPPNSTIPFATRVMIARLKES